jgi:hypothetical protein
MLSSPIIYSQFTSLSLFLVQNHEEPPIQVQVFWDMMLCVWVSTVVYDVSKDHR